VLVEIYELVSLIKDISNILHGSVGSENELN